MPSAGSTDAPSRPSARVAGRSEAESLDGVEASPKMSDVMAWIDGGQRSEHFLPQVSATVILDRLVGFRFADRIDVAERRWDARTNGRVRSAG
jgi:hypothetical protein